MKALAVVVVIVTLASSCNTRTKCFIPGPTPTERDAAVIASEIKMWESVRCEATRNGVAGYMEPFAYDMYKGMETIECAVREERESATRFLLLITENYHSGGTITTITSNNKDSNNYTLNNWKLNDKGEFIKQRKKIIRLKDRMWNELSSFSEYLDVPTKYPCGGRSFYIYVNNDGLKSRLVLFHPWYDNDVGPGKWAGVQSAIETLMGKVNYNFPSQTPEGCDLSRRIWFRVREQSSH